MMPGAGRQLSVLRVVGGLDPEFGGPSESSVNACLASQAAGVQNTLAYAAGPAAVASTEPARRRLAEAGVAVWTFGLIPVAGFHAARWALSPRFAGWVARHARDFDVVHVHQTWGLVQVAALLAAARAGTPCVVTPHESLTDYDVDRERTFAKASLKRLYLERSSLIVLASELEARDSVPPEFAEKAAVIPHPLVGAPRAPVRRPRAEGPLRVGFLGRLHPKKNADVLIRAVAAGSDRARLLVAGDGPADLKERLRAVAAEAGVEDRVEWLGFVGGDARWNFLDGLDVLAMPSEYECFGMSAAEAISRGVPVVVSEATGVADIVARHACGLVRPPTAEAFAEALRELEADPTLLAAMRELGPSAARAELSLESYGQRIDALYERVSA